MWVAIILGLAIGLIVGYFILGRRHPRSRFLARTEYWVYLPEAKLPNQDQLMTRMVQQNPHGVGRIGTREGMVFSDIRLHIALARRDKNPHVFRPDLFKDSAAPTPEILERLSESRGLVKVRYISEVPLNDDRHLQFLPHAADAIAALGKGGVIYDTVCEHLFSSEEFYHKLDVSPDATQFEFHVEIEWTPENRAVTRGLVKKGLPELATPVSPSDQRLLILELMEEFARQLWSNGLPENSMEVERYGDKFVMQTMPRSRDLTEVIITRFNSMH